MGGRAQVVWTVARNPDLRRIELGFAGFSFAEHATWLALLVFAYARGGIREAGVVATALLTAAVVVAPFAAYAGDRFAPGRALSAGYAVQSTTMILTAVGMVAELPVVAYAGAIASGATITFTRPVIGALLPRVARRPTELVASNVVVGIISDLGMFVGPLIAAGLLAVSEPSAVFAVFGLLLAVCAGLSLGVRIDDTLAGTGRIDAGALRTQVVAGLRTLRSEPAIAALLAVLGLGALAAGIVDVLGVTFAEVRLDGGGSQAGILAAGVGLGAIIGSIGASGLIGGARLTPFLALGAAALSLPIMVLAAVDQYVVALVLFAAVGMGQSLLHVTGMVAIQRRAPSQVLARIFGILESIQMLAMAIGATVVAVVLDATGMRTGLLLLGGGLFLAILASVGLLRWIAGDIRPPPADVVDRLLIDPLFTYLELPALERLALSATPLRLPPDFEVITQGEIGDRYYLIVSGEVAIIRDGELIRVTEPGDAFGEIALLHDRPRTATVRCRTATELLAIDRDDFLEAVTGHPRSLTAANEVATRRLQHDS